MADHEKRWSAPLSSDDPIGRTIFCPFDSLQGMKIIGVAGDVRQRGPDREPMPECYMPYEQHGFNGPALSLVVRTAGDPKAFTQTLRRVAHEANPEAPMKFTTLDAMLAEDVAALRFRMVLFAVFGGLAVCLAVAGIYGVVAYAVGQRSVLGREWQLAAIRLGVGFAASLVGARLLESMLFQVRSSDPLVYIAVAVMVGAARRAARIDPVSAVRHE